MGDGLYQSAVLFFIPFLAYGDGTNWSHQGLNTNGLFDFGTLCAAAGVASANIYVGVNIRYWTWITAAVIIGSTLLVFIWIPVYSALAPWPYSGTANIIYTTFSFWSIILITIFICVMPRWLIKAFRTSYYPLDKDIVREAWIAGDLKAQLGVPHRRDARKTLPVELQDTSLVDHLQRAVRDGTPQGYQAANTASPQKEPYGSPLLSGMTTPRSPTPLRSPGLLNEVMIPTADLIGTSPPKQLAYPSIPPPPGPRTHSQSTDATVPYDPDSVVHLDSPKNSAQRFTSPRTSEAFNLASGEIQRMSETSRNLRRASLDPTLPTPQQVTVNGHSSLLNRRSSRNVSGSPYKRRSMPITIGNQGLMDLSISDDLPMSAVEPREMLRDQDQKEQGYEPGRRSSIPYANAPLGANSGRQGNVRDPWRNSSVYAGSADGDVTMNFSQTSGWDRNRGFVISAGRRDSCLSESDARDSRRQSMISSEHRGWAQ